MSTQNIINYLRSCIEYDSSSKSLLDIFSPRIEHRIFISERERLLTSELSGLPVDVDKGSDALKAALLYRVEKELLYGSFFITGRIGEQVVCFPLVFFPAEITTIDGVPTINVSVSDSCINDGALSEIIQNSETSEKICAGLEECFLASAVTELTVADVITVFNEHMPLVDCSKIVHFPYLSSESQLKSFRSSDGLTLIAASLFCLVEKRSELRGVVDELKKIALEKEVSSPLNILLSDCEQPESEKAAGKHYLPAILSHAQEKILDNAETATLSVVIGPPGTGKTFTIASVAIDHLLRGETVLISSRRDQAVDVIGNYIEKLLGDDRCIVRGGRKNYLRLLKTYLQDLLNGIGLIDNELDLHQNIYTLRDELKSLEKEIEKLKNHFQLRCHAEKEYGLIESDSSNGKWKKALKKWWLSRLIKGLKPQNELLENLSGSLELKNETVRLLVRCSRNNRISDLLKYKRSELRNFLKSLRSKTSGKQEDILFSVEMDTILQAFPIWLTKTNDISRILPLKQHLFDLVIIDEATQCDIASCIPLLYRAKRAVIVGDPRQLRHLSFLSNQKMSRLALDNNLSDNDIFRFNYRDKSILDAAVLSVASQKSVTVLNEHFRSHPDIIRFSNNSFYDRKLKIMTENLNNLNEKSVFVNQCDGKRKSNKCNSKEIESIIRDIKNVVDNQKEVDQSGCYSIGITTPFHEQADEIAIQVSKTITETAMKKHSIVAGTPYAFQGEERDIMFISMSADSDTHGNVFNYINKPDVFNVMISRARISQHIYISFDHKKLPMGSLLGSYLESITAGELSTGLRESTYDNENIEEIRKLFNECSFKTYVDYRLAGTNIDIVASDGRKTVGIDLIGFPGRFIDAFSLERYLMFKRANLAIYPISYHEWINNRSECISFIHKITDRA